MGVQHPERGQTARSLGVTPCCVDLQPLTPPEKRNVGVSA